MEAVGTVFDISHYMLEDGPGIRTNVFLKGCYLRCKWCSNVYGLCPQIQLSYDPDQCIGCRACVAVCASKAIGWEEPEKISVQDFRKCRNDLSCVKVCPAKARKEIGRKLSVEEVVKEVVKDRMFYRRGEGGVTLSGGEILMQPAFAAEILKNCQWEGIHTAIETSGFGKWKDLENILQYCDSVFMDCKCMDSQRHQQLTGVNNEIIKENIKKAADYCFRNGIRFVVRLPLVPTLNDSEENLKATADFVQTLTGKPLLNILPYHNFGENKYRFLGKEYETADITIPDKEYLDSIRRILVKTSVNWSVGGYNI